MCVMHTEGLSGKRPDDIEDEGIGIPRRPVGGGAEADQHQPPRRNHDDLLLLEALRRIGVPRRVGPQPAAGSAAPVASATRVQPQPAR